ncbi:MAG: hypothetical protein RL145_1883 [Pseudomonadota bacterium]|jgi:acyl-CoA hydrolase
MMRLTPNATPIQLPSLAEAAILLAERARGGRIFIPAGPVEPLSLAEAFQASPELADELCFCGLFIPGLNRLDWAALSPKARAEVFLPSPDFAATIATGQTRVIPSHYSAAWRFFKTAPFKAAVFHLSAPDVDGFCSLSLSADASPAFFDRDVFKLGLINPSLPVVMGAPKLHLSALDAWVEADAAPAELSTPAPSGDVDALVQHVTGLIEDGATLQAGIGKLPGAIMAGLTQRRGLSIHSGLIGDWVLPLMDAGALADQGDCLKAGVILGSHALQARMAQEARLRLIPIAETHGAAHLGAIERFTSLNAALEVDLFGQINCEFAGSRTLAGVGGAVDFLRGARLSPGGKPIVMVQSLGKQGETRIVPRLSTPSVSIARSDAPILVTEQGAIDLEPLDTEARAQAIISLAAPQHQADLSAAWTQHRGARA